MDQSTFNHGKSGDTNPKGRSRSPLLELYTRSLQNEREKNIGHRTSAACGGRLRLCYTLDEGKESERETTNCPPKRVRSKIRFEYIAHGGYPREYFTQGCQRMMRAPCWPTSKRTRQKVLFVDRARHCGYAAL